MLCTSVRMAELGGGSERTCRVCGDQASGLYFGAIVCLPCKSFYIRSTKDGHPDFACLYSGSCDITKGSRLRCQACRYQRCLQAGMTRKEKPVVVVPSAGQDLCAVCGDIANGVHFGKPTCEGCKKFFRRALKEYRTYSCIKSKVCPVNPRTRNDCRYCRYHTAIAAGMSREAIRMGRPKKYAEEEDMLSGVKRARRNNAQEGNDELLDQMENMFHEGKSNEGIGGAEPAHQAELAPLYPEDFNLAQLLPQPPPSPNPLLHLALDEQVSHQNKNQCCSSSIDISPYEVSWKDSQSEDDKKDSAAVGASSSSASNLLLTRTDVCCQDFFDRAFWLREHTLRGHNDMNPVQAQLINLLCSSYDSLLNDTEEPPNTAAFFEQSSKDFFPDSEEERKPLFKLVSYRIIRITKALVDYVKTLPGHQSIEAEVLTQLCKLSFINTLYILEAVERYQPHLHNFKYFWNWKLKPTECTYDYRQELLRHGATMYSLQLDRVEKAFLMALTFIAPDWIDLKEHNNVLKLHEIYMDALKSYLVSENKGEERLLAITSVILPARELAVKQCDMVEKLTFTFDKQGVSSMPEPVSALLQSRC